MVFAFLSFDFLFVCFLFFLDLKSSLHIKLSPGTSGKMTRMEKHLELNLDRFNPKLVAKASTFLCTQAIVFAAVQKHHPVSFSKEEGLQQHHH